MAEFRYLPFATLLIGALYVTGTTAVETRVVATEFGQQTMSRQSTRNTEAVPVRATSPIQIVTLAPKKQSDSAPVLGAQDKDVSLQVPSDLTFARMEQLDTASALSESEQYLLQDLGWSSGRRGFDTPSASTVRKLPSKSSSQTVLKDFWGHFTGLSWLPYQKQLRAQNPLMHYETISLTQHDEGPTAGQHAQHAKHDVFKLGQQVLQQAATNTAYLQSRRHIDGMNTEPARSSQQHEPSAGHVVTERSGSDELLHFEVVDNPATRDPLPPVPPQHAQGAKGQKAAVVTSNTGSSEQSAQPLSDKINTSTGDYIEWPSDDRFGLALDDDTMTAWAGVPAEKEDASNVAEPGSSTGVSQLQSLQVVGDQLPRRRKYGVGSNAQPRIDLAHAKQAFAQYLMGVHGHSDLHEQQ